MKKRSVSGNLVQPAAPRQGPVERCPRCGDVDVLAGHACPPAWIARDQWDDELSERPGVPRLFFGVDAFSAAEEAAAWLFDHGETALNDVVKLSVRCVRHADGWSLSPDWIRLTVEVLCEPEFKVRQDPVISAKRRPRKRQKELL